MQLRTNIFLWVSLATLAPLTALVLGATVYSQLLYEEKIIADVNTSLSAVIAEIDRRLVFEREMLQALVDAPAVEQYLPVLESTGRGELHPEFFERGALINRFLEDFQEIVSSLNTLRILDASANTLIKVRGGQGSPAIFDGIESFPYAEEELDDEEFLERLQELTPNEVGVALLTQTRIEQDDESSMPMLDYVVPLAREKRVIGYLTANIRGEQIDRILDLAPRLHKGRLLIAEVNPEQPARHRILLYDDERELGFSELKSTGIRLNDVLDAVLWEHLQTQQEGVVRSENGDETIFFTEYYPYPNLLAHWIIATRISTSEFTAPFERIRLAIVLFAGVALLVSLGLVRFSAAKIARPVSRLADSLKSYANGDYRIRVRREGVDEIFQLADAFNYMADTLGKAHRERDKAQHMMLQNAKLASLGQMAAGIGHELNNPLGNILSYTKLIERELPEEDARLARDVGSLREEALRASDIIRGILDFARQDPPARQPVNIRQWLEETTALVQQAARKQNVTLESTGAADYPVEGDRSQLQQVLVNLLLNAIQASPEHGVVRITVRASENELTIEVRDHGNGIDVAILDRVFDPFFTTKPVGMGSGLGLSISLGIMERHGGRLEIRNHPEGGVAASMILPFARRDA